MVNVGKLHRLIKQKTEMLKSNRTLRVKVVVLVINITKQ